MPKKMFSQPITPVTLYAIDADGNLVPATEANIGEVAARLVDENGVIYGVRQVNNKPRVSAMPYTYDIAEGNIPDHHLFDGYGSREAVAVVATGSDLWTGTTATQPYPAAAGEQLEIISTAAADDGAPLGAGVQTVGIHYLDAAGDEQNEIVIMNGVGAVALAEPNVRFVQYMHTVTVGATGSAAGTITLYQQGTPAQVYAQIDIGRNMSSDTFRMVPNGLTTYITQVYATATEKSVAIKLRATSKHGVLFAGVFMSQGVYFLNDAAFEQHIIPVVVPALGMIKMTCFVPAGKAGADISGGWYGWHEA